MPASSLLGWTLQYKFLKHYKVLVLYDDLLKQRKLKGKYKMQTLSQTRWFARSRNLDIEDCSQCPWTAYWSLWESHWWHKNKWNSSRESIEGLKKHLWCGSETHSWGVATTTVRPRNYAALLVMKDIFSNCNAASKYLQRSSIDILAAIEAVNNLRTTLLSSRTDESFATYE
jgi:hypothetical protein